MIAVRTNITYSTCTDCGSMYGHHIKQSLDRPGKVANPARGQLKRETHISLSLYAPENLVSRDGFGRPNLRQPAHSPHSGSIWCLLTGFLPISAAASIYLYRHTPSGQSRVYPVTQLRTDGVHCREFAGTGPVVLKSVPVTGAAFAVITMDQLLSAYRFPHPLYYYWYETGLLKVSESKPKETTSTALQYISIRQTCRPLEPMIPVFIITCVSYSLIFTFPN